MWVPCVYCEPDDLGTGERWDEWHRKRPVACVERWFAEPEAEGEAPTPTGSADE